MVESTDLVTPDLLKQFVSDDETVMVSERVKKLKAFGPADTQDRIYVQTTDCVYTFKNGIKSRTYRIKDVGAIILSNQNTCDFMLFFERSDDLHVSTETRDDTLALLKLRFACFNRNTTLRIFGVTDAQLRTFHQTNSAKNKMAGIFDLPDDSCRLREEEIKGEEEYNEELKKKKNDVNDLPFDAKADLDFDPGESLADLTELEDDVGELPNTPITANDIDEMRQSVLVGYRANKDVVKHEDFKLVMLLGRGTFGKVFLAELTKQGKKLYAIKAIRKDVLIEYNQVQNTKLEKDILFSCEHPFLVGMDYLFQSQTRLYFVMPFIKGGELYKIFKSNKRLPEAVVKFYAAQIALAVGYLHSKGIMHRDLKLENILVDDTGYLKIIDYGLAKTLQESQVSKTFCGTPEYLAPEMVMHQGHDFSVDWWALGILIYEMLIGVTPFYNRERKLLLLKIRQSKVVFPDKKKYKIDYSDEFVDITLKLLCKDKSQRLGSNGDIDEIMNHPFFKDLNIPDLMAGKIEPPMKINLDAAEGSKIDTRYFNSKSTPQDLAETVLPQEKLDKLKKNAKQFDKFDTNKKI